MSKDEEPHNPKYVTSEQCALVVKGFSEDLKTIQKALVGDDMLGGIVKDLSDVKRDLGHATGIVRNIGVPIIVAVVTAALVYWLSLPFS